MNAGQLAWLCLAAVAAIALWAIFAEAQQLAPDPRLASQTIAAQQAVLALREAEIRALQEDTAKTVAGYEARLETVLEWVRLAQGKPQAKVQ